MTRRVRQASARACGGDHRHVARAVGRRSGRRSGRNRRDLGWRLCGVLAIAAAGATSLLHRHVLAGSLQGPASAWELVLGLTSFALASLGVVLLLQGAALHDGLVSAAPPLDPADAAPVDAARFDADRTAVASILAARAIRAAAGVRAGGGEPRSGPDASRLWTSPSRRA